VSPRTCPGVCWVAGAGIRRRPRPVVAALVVSLVIATLGRRALTR